MNFKFKAKWSKDDSAWIAACSVENPAGIIVTEAASLEALSVEIDDAVDTFLGESCDHSKHAVTIDLVR
jgi:hypothetical protein